MNLKLNKVKIKMMNFNFNPKLTEKKKAAIYTRVSTATQVEKGAGLDIQLKMCRLECEKREYIIVGEYIDAGVSGTIPAKKRKEFLKLLEDAKAGKFEVVVFYAFDRLAREIRVFLNIIDELKTYGIKIITCKENVDMTTDTGEFLVNIFASISNLELRVIKSRLSMGKKHKKEATGYVGGRIPYGYKAVNKIVQIDKDKAKIVKYIFTLYSKKYSMNKIAQFLNEKSIESPRKGKQWYPKTIGTILKNKEKYMGSLMNNNTNGVKWPVILGDINNAIENNENNVESKEVGKEKGEDIDDGSD